jgi:hypothetical protein
LRQPGNRTSSPIRIETSKCSRSQPNDPAMPQQPLGMISTA